MKLAHSHKALLVLAAVLGAVFAGARARAADQLTLKDGRVLEGEVTREIENDGAVYIWFKYKLSGVETEGYFTPKEYTSLVRDVDAAPHADDSAPAPRENGTPEPRARRSGAPLAAVISLGDGVNDTVGIYITAQKLRDLIPVLESEHIDIVVFRVNSGGGLLLEIQRLSDVIHEEYKPRFRTVAWIDSAISAAAMTSHCIEEIYFMPQGNYGACTGWSGALVAVKGRQLEEVLYTMEKISDRGRYDTRLMRAMEINYALSANIDENGDVHFVDGAKGDIVLNDGESILTLNSETAAKIKFSKGTAANLDELSHAMGLEEVDWVGEHEDGVPYPVCRAEDQMIKWRLRTAEDERRFNEYLLNYQQTFAMAAGAGDKETRGRFAGMARKNLQRIAQALRSNPNFALLQLSLPDEEAVRNWLDDEQEKIRELLRD